jgi:putative endonuclease
MLGLLYRLSDALRRRSLGTDHGRMGEDLAHRYLRGCGCTVVARNYRPRSGNGEIDLVAWHGDKLVFVEVKTRATVEFGQPERAVDAEKRGHLTRAARDYARRAGVDWNHVRFDIVAVVLRPRRVEWIRDAFLARRATTASSGSREPG